MVACLIGSTGFVGSNLRKQMSFEECYNSTNITDIEGKHFDLVICCGASAKKWWANQNEAADLAQIEGLIKSLTTITATRFVLISTIDVYPQTTSEDEDCAIEPVRNHPYGRHRYLLEEFVRTRFTEHNIVRLGALFGYGLQKNLIYDLVHDRFPSFNLQSRFQWYCVDDLAADIQQAAASRIVNFFTEPLTMAEVVEDFARYRKPRYQDGGHTVTYDLRTKYSHNGYFRSKDTIRAQLRRFFHIVLRATLCISNLGYQLAERPQIEAIERYYELKTREIVPFKTFGAEFESQAPAYFASYQNIYAFQSILYPHTENILRLEAYLIQLINVAASVGAKILVLGSPKNRSLKDMTVEQFVVFMKRMGDIATHKGVTIVLEPNAKIYGCDFLVASRETRDVILRINSSGVRLHLDVGCMFLEQEDPYEVIRTNLDILAHVHFSAPKLESLTRHPDIPYRQIFDYLIEVDYQHCVSLETLNQTPDEIDRSLYLYLKNCVRDAS